MLVHVALDEDGADLGVEPGREEPRRRLERASPQQRRIVLEGEGVQVDDAEEGVVVVLVRHPLAEGAEVVADVRRAGRLDAREDPLHRCRISGARATPRLRCIAVWGSDRLRARGR